MSLTWQQHIEALQRLLDANRPSAPTVFPTAAPAAPPAMPEDTPRQWDDGASIYDGLGMAPTSYGGPVQGFAAPSIMALAQTADINPGLARAGVTALGLSHPAVGVGLGLANLGFNATNTAANTGMLNSLGVDPGFGRSIGGVLGFNPLAGTYTGALNYGMGQQLPGWQGMQVEQEPGFNARGWADISAGMGPTAVGPEPARGAITSEPLAAPFGTEQPDVGPGAAAGPQSGYGGFDGWGGFASGGYTGAGADGVVQPWKPAGTVHEGEFVVPAHVLAGLLGWR